MPQPTLDEIVGREARDHLRRISSDIERSRQEAIRSTDIGQRADVATEPETLRSPVEVRPLFWGAYQRLGEYPLLPRARQIELGRLVQIGNVAAVRLETESLDLGEAEVERLTTAVSNGRSAVNTFVLHNLRLVRQVALGFRRRTPYVELDDIFQAGVLGLIRAAEKYDWERGYAFSTYAMWWIRQTTNRQWREASVDVHIPDHLWGLLEGPRMGHRDEPWRIQEGSSVDGLRTVLGILNSRVSFEDLVPEQQHHSLVSALRDAGNEIANEDEESSLVEQRVELERLLAHLRSRDVEIVKRYYGLAPHEAGTLDSVGRHFGITRERVRQLLNQAIKQMQQHSRSRFMVRVDN
jgi:RNA polymerase sigma factor (sigma-70 family)